MKHEIIKGIVLTSPAIRIEWHDGLAIHEPAVYNLRPATVPTTND